MVSTPCFSSTALSRRRRGEAGEPPCVLFFCRVKTSCFFLKKKKITKFFFLSFFLLFRLLFYTRKEESQKKGKKTVPSLELSTTPAAGALLPAARLQRVQVVPARLELSVVVFVGHAGDERLCSRGAGLLGRGGDLGGCLRGLEGGRVACFFAFSFFFVRSEKVGGEEKKVSFFPSSGFFFSLPLQLKKNKQKKRTNSREPRTASTARCAMLEPTPWR